MKFEPIDIQGCMGDGIPPIPELTAYCTALLDALPKSTEVYLADPEYDANTLHSSLGFRAAIAVYGPGTFEIDWTSADPHSITPSGNAWKRNQNGLALKYKVTYTPPPAAKKSGRKSASKVVACFLSIQFEKLV